MDKRFSYKKIKETGDIPPEVKEAMDRVNRLYDAWLSKQEKDFEDNKEGTKAHLAIRKKIVPPNFKRFWKWYFDYCAEHDFPLNREIEPRDFVLYDKWERTQMYANPDLKKDKKLSPKICAIALALAYKRKGKDNKIDQKTANSKKAIIALADDLFPFNAAGIYDEWRIYKNSKLEHLESLPEYDQARELLKELFV